MTTHRKSKVRKKAHVEEARIVFGVKWPFGRKGTCFELFTDKKHAQEFARFGHPKGKVVRLSIKELKGI